MEMLGLLGNSVPAATAVKTATAKSDQSDQKT
jgi:hypothetical protein